MKHLFEKIKFIQLYTLCNTLAECEIRNTLYIKGKYIEKCLFFDETLLLLKELKIITEKNDKLFFLKSFQNPISIESFKKTLLIILLSSNGNSFRYVYEFLINFHLENDKTLFRPNALEKIKYSNIRNLLIELEFLVIENKNSDYIINPIFLDLFINTFVTKKLSPISMKMKQDENDLLGLSAEIEIIKFETRRLTSIKFNPEEIKHVSQFNVLAGYDIQSFENHLDCNENRIERYIEVKAVSIDDHKFYWSKNEIEVAEIYGENYFLYLLPVKAKNNFDIDKLIIIRDPFKEVYRNDIEWCRQVECTSFFKTYK